MPTPSSGAISISQIATIVYNNASTVTGLNDTDVRTLIGIPSGTIAMSSAYGKPVPNSYPYPPGTYTFYAPAYEYLTAVVAGGGGAGGGFCGGQFWFYGCINYCATGAGYGGGWSSFNGVTSYGGGGGQSCGGAAGAAGGNNQNGSLGGGGAGGLGNNNPADTNCNQAAGAAGGAGGIATRQWKKAVDGPAYGGAITVYVGAGGVTSGGGCRYLPGGSGGSGYVNVYWS